MTKVTLLDGSYYRLKIDTGVFDRAMHDGFIPAGLFIRFTDADDGDPVYFNKRAVLSYYGERP